MQIKSYAAQKKARIAFFIGVQGIILIVVLTLSLFFGLSASSSLLIRMFIFVEGLTLLGIISYYQLKKKKELVLMLASFIFFLVAMEIFLSVMSCDAVARPLDLPFQYNYVPEKIHCSKIYDGLQFHFKVNSDGFVDNEFETDSDYTIFLLGDSFAECTQSNICVHQILESNLSQIYGKNIRVYNFGIGGYGTIHSLGILKYYAEIYNPDLVLLYFLPQNDVMDNLKIKTDYREMKIREYFGKILRRTSNFIIQSTTNLISKINEKIGVRHIKVISPIENYKVYSKE